MPKIQFLTMPGCHNCEATKKIFDEIMPDFLEMEVEEIDMMTPEGQELVQKHSIMASPGIIINGELFSTGTLNKEDFVKKLNEIKQEVKK